MWHIIEITSVGDTALTLKSYQHKVTLPLIKWHVNNLPRKWNSGELNMSSQSPVQDINHHITALHSANTKIVDWAVNAMGLVTMIWICFGQEFYCVNYTSEGRTGTESCW